MIKKTLLVLSSFAVIALVLLALTYTTPSSKAVTTQDQNQANFEHLLKVQPKPLSSADWANAAQIALSNSEIKQIINGRPYTWSSGGMASPNANAVPVIWNPEVSINVDNITSIGVDVDLANNKVIKYESSPITNLGPPITGPQTQTQYGNDNFSDILIVAFVTSILDVFAVIIVGLTDRFLIKSLLSKSYS